MMMLLLYIKEGIVDSYRTRKEKKIQYSAAIAHAVLWPVLFVLTQTRERRGREERRLDWLSLVRF